MASKTKFFFHFVSEHGATAVIKHKKYLTKQVDISSIVEFDSYTSWGLPTTFEITNTSKKNITFVGGNFFVEGISDKKQMLTILGKKINGETVTDQRMSITIKPGDVLLVRCRGSLLKLSQL
jgi:hypothetical protein